MPIIKSAKKRVKIANKASVRNAKTKRTLRESLKAFAKALESGKSAEIAKTEREAMRAIDLAAKKAVLHKNKAARKKSQISAQAKAKGVKPVKAEAKKAAAKPKAAAKAKAPAKKTSAKKPVAKKTTK
jgi:small subunit ribosomal protein S20